ncbi:hypothetical protein [Chryseobacterium turcicum]|uniref:Uncharacterized protein n=1 Tax=Chryseobacterium turcicum TaxID=2898076 RepID=A0A9Q3YY71_9FLAO|nr:hypothetical protein [Chryseobacterium turcicum]MCD1115995.1 hypothetical protein [Chryseobacterium turcicum]
MEKFLTNSCKTYRLETIVISNPETSYSREKSYVRTAEVYDLGKENNYFKYQILIVDFNFSDDDNAMGKLIKQISYLFDELILTIDEEGNIISVENLLFLQLRWTKIQTDLLKLHQGNVVENYFNQINMVLENEPSLIEFLQEYNMFGLLFNGLWNSFEERRIRKTKKEYVEIMTPEKKGGKIIQIISAENLEQSDVTYFRGINIFSKNNLVESFIEIKKHQYHLKHSLLWIG